MQNFKRFVDQEKNRGQTNFVGFQFKMTLRRFGYIFVVPEAMPPYNKDAVLSV